MGWKLVATKKVDGFVLAGAFSKRNLKGVQRPGIAALMPTAKGRTVILDVGANVFPKAHTCRGTASWVRSAPRQCSESRSRRSA